MTGQQAFLAQSPSPSSDMADAAPHMAEVRARALAGALALALAGLFALLLALSRQ